MRKIISYEKHLLDFKRLYLEGKKYQELRKRFNCSDKTISRTAKDLNLPPRKNLEELYSRRQGLNFCRDCSADISYLRGDAKRCKDCYKIYRHNYFAIYRKGEKRKETVRKDNATKDAKERKKRYNKSIKGRKSHYKYRMSNKGRSSQRAQVLTRRSRLAKIDGKYSLTAAEVRIVRNEYSRCAFCGSKQKLEIEHLIPVSRGGDK
jgi:hypothetical protein